MMQRGQRLWADMHFRLRVRTIRTIGGPLEPHALVKPDMLALKVVRRAMMLHVQSSTAEARARNARRTGQRRPVAVVMTVQLGMVRYMVVRQLAVADDAVRVGEHAAEQLGLARRIGDYQRVDDHAAVFGRFWANAL